MAKTKSRTSTSTKGAGKGGRVARREQAPREAMTARDKRELDAADEPQSPGRYFVPDTDIYETADALLVVMEMPGVTRDRLDVRLDKNILSVEGRIDFGNYADLRPVYTEYNVGNFSRSFQLAGDFDPDGITATLADGVLTLELAKREAAKPRRIPVE
ncbi:MAG: Hsp20/alpha crystallin family protein [Gammaproteobacteria bacterium]|nr:Hsp20/alpha crystallin family protein [Gammaproteobacteria bacterium]